MTLLPYPHLTLLALSFLDARDVCNVREVCKDLWDMIGRDFDLWKGLIARDFGGQSVKSAFEKNSGHNPFIVLYKELNLPHCNGLGVKFTCTRSEGEIKGTVLSELPVLELVSVLHFTITLINQTDNLMCVHSGYSNRQPKLLTGSAYVVQHEGKKLQPKSLGHRGCGTGAHPTFFELLGRKSMPLRAMAYLVLLDTEKLNTSRGYNALRNCGKIYVLFFFLHGKCSYYFSLGDNMYALKEMRIFPVISNNGSLWEYDLEGEWNGKITPKGLPIV